MFFIFKHESYTYPLALPTTRNLSDTLLSQSRAVTGELDTKVARVVGGKLVDDLPDGATNHIKYDLSSLHFYSILTNLSDQIPIKV